MNEQFPNEDTPETAAGQQPSPATASKKKTWIFAGIGAVVVIALLVWVLITQVFATDSEETDPPKPTTTTKPTTEPTTEPEKPAAPIVLPDCEALNPEGYAAGLEVAKRYAEQGMTGVTAGEGDYEKFPLLFGPAAQTAIEHATQSRACLYPFNSESFLMSSVAELPKDARDALEQSLKADSDFVRSEVNGAAVFTWHNTEFSGYRLQSYTVHAFLGDIWFASSGEDDSAPTTEAAIAAIRAANPTLP